MARPETFFEYQSRLFRLYSERNYPEARDLAEEAGRRFPKRVGRTIHWRACLPYNFDPHKGVLGEPRRAGRSPG